MATAMCSSAHRSRMRVSNPLPRCHKRDQQLTHRGGQWCARSPTLRSLVSLRCQTKKTEKSRWGQDASEKRRERREGCVPVSNTRTENTCCGRSASLQHWFGMLLRNSTSCQTSPFPRALGPTFWVSSSWTHNSVHGRVLGPWESVEVSTVVKRQSHGADGHGRSIDRLGSDQAYLAEEFGRRYRNPGVLEECIFQL